MAWAAWAAWAAGAAWATWATWDWGGRPGQDRRWPGPSPGKRRRAPRAELCPTRWVTVLCPCCDRAVPVPCPCPCCDRAELCPTRWGARGRCLTEPPRAARLKTVRRSTPFHRKQRSASNGCWVRSTAHPHMAPPSMHDSSMRVTRRGRGGGAPANTCERDGPRNHVEVAA